MKKHALISLIFFLALSKSISAQQMLKKVSLSKQIEKSTLVLEGKVLSKKSFWDKNHEKIYTINTVEVYKVFKGDTLPIIEIITLGGVLGMDAQIVHPSLKLNIDDIGLFTLYNTHVELESKMETNKMRFKPYGSLQGFYKYDLDSNTAANRFTSKKGITNSFYNEIMSYTKTDYIQLTNFDVQNKTSISSKTSNLFPVTITNFSPTTSTAGTASVLTITGSNFGTTKGKVGFSNADKGGSGYVNALDSQVLTWTNTRITVEIPSEAGTGRIKVTHNDGSFLTSSSTLFIKHAQVNIVSDQLNPGVNVAYKTQLVDDNGSGGYTWHMSSVFSEQSGAKEALKRALTTWSCKTQINWILNESNIITSPGAQHKANSDDINVLSFDNSTSTNPDDDLPDTVLSLRTLYYSACTVIKNSAPSLDWYVIEFDIMFDDETNWNFNSQKPSSTEFDFESAALHELGHCRQMDHIIDTDNIMHFAIAEGESLRSLSADNIEGANMIQKNSTDKPVCGKPLMTNFSGSCALGIEEDILNKGIRIYPNPTKGNLFISNDGLVNLEKIVIYDVSGRLISQQDISNTSRLRTVRLNGLSKGVYLVNIHSDKTFITKKIIKD
ncbi:T9SS type A sorting domain-containing protein [Algibacter sp. 2305UL17-15]|uniref:T9SS type A sorting domain-containing protein n=1 Tax=Algibacter sp. 2305UL17-15 TaxID=3231268 RepID=UPI003459310B